MARLDLTNRDIGQIIIAVMLAFAGLGFFGFVTFDAQLLSLARDFLILAGTLLTSETARRAIKSTRNGDQFPSGDENQQPQQPEQQRRSKNQPNGKAKR